MPSPAELLGYKPARAPFPYADIAAAIEDAHPAEDGFAVVERALAAPWGCWEVDAYDAAVELLRRRAEEDSREE